MKKVFVLLIVVFIIAITGCSREVTVKKTYEGSWKNTYCEMSDGTWQCDGYSYKYRLEISGRIPNAVKDTTYVYLSNIEDIPFERAYLAGGLSSNSNDYFASEEAMLVDFY